MSGRIQRVLIGAAVVTACIALVAIALAPNFRQARTGIARPCINTLRRIDGATQTWALDNGKTTNDTPTWEDIRPYLSRDGGIPGCPQGGKYTLGRKGTPPMCSYPGHRLPE